MTSKYDEILQKMQETMVDLQQMIQEEQSIQSRNIGANHRIYSKKELDDEMLKQSEKEASISGEDAKFYRSVESRAKSLLTYTDKFEKDESGNVVLDEQGNPKKEVEVKKIEVEVRNFNKWSVPVSQMSKEEQNIIKRKALMNIHAGEEQIGKKDIRARIVGDKIEFTPRYSEEESKKRFKFTRKNEVDTVHQVPICNFYINDELIFTMDVEKQMLSNPLIALEYKYADINDGQKMDEVDRLCLEIHKKTNIEIKPDELFAYLDSGYLINGKLE